VLFEPDEVGSVAVEGRVLVGVLHEVEECSAEGLEGPCGAPVGLDDVEADLPGHEVDVGVEDLALEVHLGRHDGILRGEGDFDQKYMVGIGRIGGPLDEGLPSKQVVLVEHQQELAEPLLGRLDGLLHQPLLVHVGDSYAAGKII
jgi:hypothetical protein